MEAIKVGRAEAAGVSKIQQIPKIVVIDDDRDFRELIERAGHSRGIAVTTFDSLLEMGSFARLREFDVAIVDFHLNSFSGLEVAEYVDVFFKNIPIVMVSASDLDEQLDHWPDCVREFVSKSAGIYSILDSAVAAIRPSPLGGLEP